MSTTRTGRLRPRLAGAEAAARDALAWVRAGIAAEGLERRIVWIAVGLVLVLGPAAFNLLRSDSFAASVELVPREVGPFQKVEDAAYYRRFLSDFVLVDQMRRTAAANPVEYRDATIAQGEASLRLTVAARTPERAQQLVNALARQVADATARQIGTIASYRLADIDAILLERPRPPAEERLRLYRERKALRELGDPPPPRAVVAARAAEPPLTRVADKIADALPGKLPARPSPFWAGFAGLLLFGTLWVAASALLPPPGREAASVRGGSVAEALRRRFYAPPPEVPEPEPEPREPLALGWRGKLAWIGLLVAMPVLTLALIAKYGENVPFYDEWTNASLFEQYDNGRLTFSDFWAQHMEHRPVIPRAADFLTGQATAWDLRVEMHRNFVVAIAGFLLVLLALRRTLDRNAFLGTSVVASVIFFSPVQWENWLWGWQLEWFLANLATFGAFLALAFVIDRRPRGGLALAIGCGVVATFSLGGGLLVWPIGLVILLLRRRPWRLWVAFSVLVFAVYFAGWENPGNTPDKTEFLQRPVDYAKFVTLYFGRALALSDATGYLVGVAVMLACLGAIAYVVAHRHDRWLVDRSSVWLAIGLYSLGSGLITGVSRVNIPVAHSRYATVGNLAALAAAVLVVIVVRRNRVGTWTITPQVRRAVRVAALVPLLLIALLNARHGAMDMREHGARLDRIAECSRTARTATTPCLKQLNFSPYPETFAWITYLREKRWAGYEPLP